MEPRRADTGQIAGQKYDVKMKYVLQALIKSIESSPLARTSSPKVDWDPYPMNAEKGEILTQDYLWPVKSTALSLPVWIADMIVGTW